MRIMAGPMTTGGKILSSSFLPCHFTRALMAKYTRETLVSPAIVPGSPHCLVAAIDVYKRQDKKQLRMSMIDKDGKIIHTVLKVKK